MFERLEKLDSKEVELNSGVSFHQETKKYGSRFTNFYWVLVKKGKVKFDICSSESLTPLRAFVKKDKNVCAGINFGTFFLTDDNSAFKCSYYNLLVNKGKVLQPPSNSRTALLCDSNKLEKKSYEAKGTLKIGEKMYTWSGAKDLSVTQLKVYGMFDVGFQKGLWHNQRNIRVVDQQKSILEVMRKDLLLGVEIINEIPTISKISEDRINLLDYQYVFRGKRQELGSISVGERLTDFVIDGDLIPSDVSLCSSSFSLGRNEVDLKNNLYKELVYDSGSNPKPLDPEFMKSWSVILETDDSYVFLINDARPRVDNQRGITVFELQNYLLEKFNYNWGLVGDSGQSSKLMVSQNGRRKVYGNLHYINYKSSKPFWDGVDGRPISVAVFIYDRVSRNNKRTFRRG